MNSGVRQWPKAAPKLMQRRAHQVHKSRRSLARQLQTGLVSWRHGHTNVAAATIERKIAMQALLYTPEETAEILSIGRSRVFDLLRNGSLRSVKIGSSRRIPGPAITEFIESLSTDGQGI